MGNSKGLIILPRLQVSHANAISGPLSWGFPAPSAFTGFVHALERQRPESYSGLKFEGVGIVCHGFDPQVSQPAGKRSQVFHLTRNPLGKDGKPGAIVEEGRVHLEVTLVIGLAGYIEEQKGQQLANWAMQQARRMRIAGGSLLPARNGRRFEAGYYPLSGDPDARRKELRQFMRRLLPGFILCHRPEILQQHLQYLQLQSPESTRLDALLDLTRLNIDPVVADSDKPDDVTWHARISPAWLVPLPIGYGAISALYPPGEVGNCRDSATPFRFVESLYSLGEWCSPHRLESLAEWLWYHQAEPENGLYICNHRKATNAI
ncbi:type I-F CRISPR-associated protein Csy2 [Marinobacterium jannaschii]|uniref:type I-F CRISPR-associated protein Csy2 n=1 Tax=Marinobacterium jannaschii TaxID=64970 RepID=UPI000481FB76|nr:type I-F CRISPR-associated protein Csy2 [Marinobacterium jannaschii]